MMTMRTALVAAACCALVVTVGAQNRKLGPKDRDTILDARVDASYTSTPLSSLVFLPFSNELDYAEGADVLSQNFIAAMQQKHPDIKIKGPEETRQLIKDLKLANDYRSFSGNYTNTGVFTTPFLQALSKPAKIDAVLLGRVLAYGAQRETRAVVTGLGTITWNRDRAVAGMELTLVRSSDGRELWRGVHAVEGAKNENVIEVSKTVGTVFASFFGRRPY
jgi:hypothetical protein